MAPPVTVYITGGSPLNQFKFVDALFDGEVTDCVKGPAHRVKNTKYMGVLGIYYRTFTGSGATLVKISQIVACVQSTHDHY